MTCRLRPRPASLLLAGILIATAGIEAHAQQERPSQASGAHAGLRLSIAEAVARSVQLNEQVLVARADRAAARGAVREIRADALPELSADFGYTRNIQTPVLFFNTDEGVQQISIGDANEYSFRLGLRQTLLDFSLGPARAAARLAEDASLAGVEATRDEVALQTRLAYYTVLLDRALVRVEEKALEAAQRRLAQVEEFYEVGTGSEFDLLTAQVEVDNIRPGLIEARNQLELDLNELKRAIGLPLDSSLVLTDSFPAPADVDVELDQAVQRALAQRSDLQAQRLSVELRGESLTSERAGALPSLLLDAAILRRASSADVVPPSRDFSQSTSVGLSLEWPIFDGAARSGRIQQAQAVLERERYRLRQLREDVRLEVQQTLLARDAAREEIAASDANVRRAERALEIAQSRFRNGLSTQVELEDAELAVTEARTNYARALYRFAVADARLRAAMGER